MEKIKVYILKKNEAYFALLDDFNKRTIGTISDITWLPYKERVEAERKQFYRELEEKGIPNSEIIKEECDMVYVNYEAFNCVLLHGDGTYTQHSLSEVKQIR
jgi:hypothetical protein